MEHISYFFKKILFIFACLGIIFSTNADKVVHDWSSKPYGVYCLGQPIYDIVYKFNTEAELKEHLKPLNINIGENKLITSAEISKILNTSPPPYYKGAGGGASNTAMGLAAAGEKVLLAGVVNNDELGDLYKKELKKYNVATNLAIEGGDGGTGAVIVMIAPDTERTMMVYPGVSQRIDKVKIDMNVLSQYKVFLSEGYFWHRPGNDRIVLDILKQAKSLNTKTAFSFGDRYIVEKYKKDFLLMLNDIDVIFSNKEQILALFSTADLDKAIQELQKFNCITTITMAKDGVLIVTKDQVIKLDAMKVENVVDTTGAGDQFAAGFLRGYLNNMSLKESGQLGIQEASNIIQRVGGHP